VLNALSIDVLDQYDNPIEGATVTYTAPAGVTVAPGLGEDGVFYSNFRTRRNGRHIAMVSTAGTTVPTIDEFGGRTDANLAHTYMITASVPGTAVQDYTVDVDMGPSIVTNSAQSDSALIGQPLTHPVQKIVLRWERVDGPDVDFDFRNETFVQKVQKSVPGVTVKFKVRRGDGKSEASVGLTPTSTAAPSVVTGAQGIASVGTTMGDVGGVQNVIGEADRIPVDFVFANGTPMQHVNFTDGKKFGEATVVRAIPVVITVTVSDTAAGVDFATVRSSLNGTTFFNGAAAQNAALVFPETLELVVGGVARGTWGTDTISNSAFLQLQVRYQPTRRKLVMSNTVQVEQVKDKVKNQQAGVTTQVFSYP